MYESNGGSRSPVEVLQAVLEEAGAADSLHWALQIAQIHEPPTTREGMFEFVEGPLQEALVGTLHPVTVSQVLASVREQLAGINRSGTRKRADPEISGPASVPPGAPTMPPPLAENSQADYADLVSGAVHSRVTPTWEVGRVDPSTQPREAVWAIVSNDSDLVRHAEGAAPAIDVVVVSSMAVLEGALNRGGSPASAVILDAGDPSISMDKAIACLTSDATNIRVILWRMPTERRARLVAAIPYARTWLPCEAEVTPIEILQLLRL